MGRRMKRKNNEKKSQAKRKPKTRQRGPVEKLKPIRMDRNASNYVRKTTTGGNTSSLLNLEPAQFNPMIPYVQSNTLSNLLGYYDAPPPSHGCQGTTTLQDLLKLPPVDPIHQKYTPTNPQAVLSHPFFLFK